MSDAISELPPALEPPAPNETVELTMDDGAAVLLRRHGKPDGPRVALSHGNGLAIEAYYPFWRLLTGEFDVVLFDVRNHGRNPLHTESGHHWDRFVQDFEVLRRAMDEHFGARRVIGIFHSLSAIAAADHAIRAAKAAGDRPWDPLVLVDPPMFPREGHPLAPVERDNMKMMGQLARRRAECYERPEDMARQLIGNPAFARWVPGAHLLFARETLRRDRDGQWRLACPRTFEARIFETNIDPTLWPRLATLPVAVKLVGADPSVEFLEMPSKLARALADDQGLDFTMIPDTTHFLQLERPQAVWQAIRSFLVRQRVI